jgi:peptidoglycan/xylan/chitin deacetylase (PgdA/CDA1 family)
MHLTSRIQKSELSRKLTGFTRRRLARYFARQCKEIRPSKAMISFCFDDFPHSALAVGGDILRRHGVAGTYYVSLGLMWTDQPTGRMFSREDLAKLIREGHELGCHTFSHCDAWQTKPANFEAAIVENQRALENWFPPAELKTLGAEFKTLSYPINSPRPQNKRIAARHFACCRGGGQGINVGNTDLNNLNALFLEQSRDDVEAVMQMIGKNERERGWLIFATHDISQNPTRFGCTPSFFETVVRAAVQSDATILPVFRAFQHLEGRSLPTSFR